jgi:hypothetical protein
MLFVLITVPVLWKLTLILNSWWRAHFPPTKSQPTITRPFGATHAKMNEATPTLPSCDTDEGRRGDSIGVEAITSAAVTPVVSESSPNESPVLAPAAVQVVEEVQLPPKI